MCLMEVAHDEIDRVLHHPLPPCRYPFDVVALRDLVARCYSLTEEEKYWFVDSFGRFSVARAERLALILIEEQAIFAARNETHVRRVRSTFHVVR